jgi:hypothetical protein
MAMGTHKPEYPMDFTQNIRRVWDDFFTREYANGQKLLPVGVDGAQVRVNTIYTCVPMDKIYTRIVSL